MKRLFCLLLTALLLAGLPACGCSGGENADLVFINDSDTVIMAVMADFRDQGGVAQNADSSPLKRGESFGFEAGGYPVTVTVYDRPFEGFGQRELARVTIGRAPGEGERWYVTARDGANGLILTTDISLPVIDAG